MGVIKISKLKMWPADQVERRPIADLIPAARNARTHNNTQIAQIAASLEEWGWTNPVLIDEMDRIIAGHGRILAAQALGWPEVPVMVAVGWTDAQKRAYIIADNKLALNADWDEELLTTELNELRSQAYDIGVIGFDTEELGALLDISAKIREETEPLKPKRFMRVLVSVPVDVAISAKEVLDKLATVPGIEIDYGAN
jgi:ParB-like chromosome segregation protein Spo0J